MPAYMYFADKDKPEYWEGLEVGQAFRAAEGVKLKQVEQLRAIHRRSNKQAVSFIKKYVPNAVVQLAHMESEDWMDGFFKGLDGDDIKTGRVDWDDKWDGYGDDDDATI